MSQPPPPPPNQPPQPGGAGFGEPQDPRDEKPSLEKQQGAGGYGYPPPGPGGPEGAPGQPAQAGGYGYPQAPGQPPGQPPQGGFGGPPPAAPGPYGQPQPGPYGQPPYGQGPYGAPYGQQPGPYGPPGTAPTMPPASRPAGGGGSKPLVIIAAVVAVLLIAGGGVWFLTQDDDGGGTDAPQASTQGGATGGGTDDGGGGGATGVNGKLLFTMDAPAVSDSASAEGAWATEKYFVKSSIGKILGVNASDGSSAWEISLDGEVCAASPYQTKDDKTAVVTKESDSEDADCNQMVVIDLRSGKEVWQKTLPNDADVNSLGGGVTMSQGTIAAVWIGGSVGYRLSDGDQLWLADSGSNCRDEGFAGGDKLVAVVRCGSYSEPEYRVQTLNHENGKPLGEYEVPAGTKSVNVASTDPLVIGVGAGEYGTTDVMMISDDHKLESKITLGDQYHDPCRSETESCWTIAASDDYVFLATKDHDVSGEDYGRTNAVMAFDLHSGDTKWKADAGTNREIMPIGMDGGKLLAYRTATYDKGGEIVTVDPKTQKETLLLRLPSGNELDYEKEMAPQSYSAYTKVIYEHGRLFFHDHLISDRAGAFTNERVLAVGYGAG